MQRRDFLMTGGIGLAMAGAGGLVLANQTQPVGSSAVAAPDVGGYPGPAIGAPHGAGPPPVQAPTVARSRGILGKKAPNLDVATWFRLPKGKRSVDLADFKGDVLYLYFFQSWCPGCHKSGFPTLKSVSTHFAKTPGVSFAAVQTVFEGFGTNTAAKAKAMAERYDLKLPVGHDAGSNDSGSRVMRRYRSGGTPWTVIVDKSGIVRFNAFHIRPKSAISLIDGLRRSG